MLLICFCLSPVSLLDRKQFIWVSCFYFSVSFLDYSVKFFYIFRFSPRGSPHGQKAIYMFFVAVWISRLRPLFTKICHSKSAEFGLQYIIIQIFCGVSTEGCLLIHHSVESGILCGIWNLAQTVMFQPNSQFHSPQKSVYLNIWNVIRSDALLITRIL